jgi:molecular chaperone GrpE
MTRRPEEHEDEVGDEAGEGEAFDALGAAEELEASLAEASGAGEGGGGADAYVEMLEGEIAAMQLELVQARERVARAEERRSEAEAEVERAVDRLSREAERERERQHRGGLRRILEVLDDLERAISSARQMDHNPQVLAGVELVRKRFLDALGELGVRHVPAQGERFDPALHEAMSAVPVDDPGSDGVVVGVVAEGYAIGEEVLRPAKVAVGRSQ